jgi:hypothetical protein
VGNERSHDLEAAAGRVLAEVTKLYLRGLPFVDGHARTAPRTHLPIPSESLYYDQKLDRDVVTRRLFVHAVERRAPGYYFELVARQTSGSIKNVAADELTWFAVEVVA